MLPPHRQCSSRLAIQLRKRAQDRLQRRNYASITDLPRQGDSLHGFTLKRSKHVKELDLTALQFQHDKTGAEHLHIAREDKNNVFAIGFKTNPPDHTGVPHILEHVTLCGSKKYPVRDPFFKMMPRSLQNFMNAMTSQDHTTYPFATTNPQDFRNLMSVYLDATLHPLLKQQDFAQEGWRIGPADVPASEAEASKDIAEENFKFKGVVYNEMKGSMSNADTLFYTKWRDHIYPSLNNSGGMPQQMTNLTHSQLKQYHAEHYHPSNTKIFTYGNLPVQEHLQSIGSQLDQFEKRDIDTSQKLPVSLDSPKSVKVLGPLDENFAKNEQFKVSMSWIMSDTSNVLETFSLAVIASILLEGFGSPIYQNTIGVGWGSSYSANTGFDASGKKAIFTVGLNGMKRSDMSRLNDGIRNTFDFARVQGDFASAMKINSRIQPIELEMKHKSAHFGMGLMSRLTDSWFNDVDPMSAVAIEETLSAFREKCKDPKYLEKLFDKYFNTENTLTFTMSPSEDFEKELAEDESSRLKSKIDEISSQHSTPEEARKSLAKQEFDLQQMQETAKTEDVSCLPSVYVKDIPRQMERKDVRNTKLGNVNVQWREAPTNGLTYVRGIMSLKDLPDDLRVYVPLWTTAMQRLGSRDYTTTKLEDLIKLHCGGINIGHHSSTSPLDLDVCEEGIAFSSFAMDRHVLSMWELLRISIQEIDFYKYDTELKISELVKSAASNAVNDVSDMGHVYARWFAESGLTPQSRLLEEVNGMTQVRLMMDLAPRALVTGFEDVLEKFKLISSIALANTNNMRIAITCGPDAVQENEKQLQTFLDKFPSDVRAPELQEQTSFPVNQKCFFPLPYQVYYSALSRRTTPYASPDSAPLKILAELLTHRRIHHEIREKGGAYGGSAYASGLRGIFGFTSYRDPNPLNSIKVMNEAGEWARAQQWSDRDLEEAKLSVFQAIDAPESVNEEGMTKFLTGVDHEMEQQHREQLLDVKAKDLNDVADKYLVREDEERHPQNIAVLGREIEGFREEKGWTQFPLTDSRQQSVNEESNDEVQVI